MDDFHSHSESQFMSSLSPPPPDLMPRTSSADVHSIPATSASRTSNSDVACLSSSGSMSARYKLLSPAKLPISRSTCITIPPGLSPSSFLESPILLSNVKVEPSPTTGSFLNPQFMYFSGGASGLSFASNTSNRNPVGEREVGHFQFKLPTQSNPLTGLSAAAPLEIEASGQDQSQPQPQPQSSAAVPSIKPEMAPLPREPVPMFAERSIISVAVDSDELNQGVATNPGALVLYSDQNDAGNLTVPDRSSDDGYNWRKYGQKLVKGCEFPRSYYKCTHPNCEVKKIFERTPEGHIKEIVYKGTHDHPKPQPTRRFGAGSIVAMPDSGLSSTMREDKNTMNAQMSHATEPNGNSDLSPGGTNDDGPEGVQYNNDENDDDDPFSKRRKMEVVSFDVTPVVKPIREPRVVVQTISEVDILDDGYRWRKYGQKVVRGNPNPRSYYKCTSAGCPVRKHVERASHDPKAVITTYEGKHNHDVPTAKNNNNNNNNGSHDNSNGGGPRMIRSEDNNAVNLGLGVGIGSGSEEQQHHNAFGVESYRSQVENRNGNFNVLQIMPVQGGYYGGVVNNGQFLSSRQSHHVVD